MAAGVTLVGATLEYASRADALAENPAPGRLVDVGAGRRIQIDCRGSGSPTVVFESGLDNFGSLAWASVHDSIAKNTRACAYSRAGIMWSDPVVPANRREPAIDLHTALTVSGERPPYVMVAHSLGGPYTLAFTKRYGTDVHGIVFVDATNPDQFPRYEAAVGKSIMPTPTMVRIGAALAWTGILRVLPSPAPPSSWPEEVRKIAPAFLPRSIGALAEETAAIPRTIDRARDARALGDRPVIVLSAGEPNPAADLELMGLTAEQGAKLFAAHQTVAADMATWSTHARLEQVAGANHYIQFDRPDAVIRAVNEVVRYVIADDTGAGRGGLRGMGRRVPVDRAGAP